MKMLRTVLGYAAMAVGVTVGGVLVGAIVVAPAVSRSKPLFARTFSNAGQQLDETGGPVGQADGDPRSAAATASVAADVPFKPLAETIAANRKAETIATIPRRTGFKRVRYEVADRFEDVLLAAGRVPKIFWVFADIGAVLLMAGVWFWRKRPASAIVANVLPSNSLDKRFAAALPARLVPGKGSRTPKTVVSLAESGSSPADIARRTGLALDAVAMLISMGTLGARQLRPPTA